jgi:DUF4097 and DUF4098 domain-containing protein YvlB
VSLENVNGDVVIEAWNRDEVRVHAVKRAGSPELLAELEVKIDATSDHVDIDTHYPSTMRSGHGSSVEYMLTVPSTARLDSIDLVNGDLRMTGVEGGVEADSVNGTIRSEGVAGDVDLATVNGAIELDASTIGGGDELTLDSVNGSIEVILPASADASLDAETVNGSIDNDLGIEVRKGEYVGSSMHGTLASGAGRLSIETVNGPISVHGR